MYTWHPSFVEFKFTRGAPRKRPAPPFMDPACTGHMKFSPRVGVGNPEPQPSDKVAVISCGREVVISCTHHLSNHFGNGERPPPHLLRSAR